MAILHFVRATDLAAASEVDKTVFARHRVQMAVAYQLQHVYGASLAAQGPSSPPPPLLSSSKSLSSSSSSNALTTMDAATPLVLYAREVKCVLWALQSPQPLAGSGCGYWVSTSWVANAKKYYDTLASTLASAAATASTPTKKQAKIRQRRGSDALPPWPSMTADITCVHGALALTKGARAKKRLLSSRAWKFLRRFYPEGPTYKAATATECPPCTAGDEEAKASASEQRAAELRARRTSCVAGPLEAVALRKSGVPSHLTTAGATHAAMTQSDWTALVDAGTASAVPDQQRQPLLPGLYNLVPKPWLRAWRQYAKDPTVTALPPLDCTCLLCPAHNQLVLPPHFQEYIVGLRRSLLGGLGAGHEGEVVVEVLSAEEWDALLHSLRSLSDFGVRFCLDGEGIAWNVDVCTRCVPCAGGATDTTTAGRKTTHTVGLLFGARYPDEDVDVRRYG